MPLSCSIFLDRFNSHCSQCLDCHCPAVDQWLPALWDWSIVVKSGKWMICSVSDTSKLNLLISVQLSPGELKEAMELHPPRLMICSVEFLASEEVLFIRTWTVFIFFKAILIWHAGSKRVAGLSACTPRQKANCCDRRGSSENLFYFEIQICNADILFSCRFSTQRLGGRDSGNIMVPPPGGTGEQF